MSGPIDGSAGVTHPIRITSAEGPFAGSDGEAGLQAPLGPAAMARAEGLLSRSGCAPALQPTSGPADMAFSVDPATATRLGSVHVVWRALDDSLGLLTAFFVERKDPGGWTAVRN